MKLSTCWLSFASAASLLAVIPACATDAPEPEPDVEVVSGSLTLSAPAMARVARTTSVEIPLTIARTGFDGDVTVEVDGLPANVTAELSTIAAGETTGTLTLTAAAGATLASRTLVTLHATAGDSAVDATMEVLIVDPPGTLDVTFDVDGQVFADLGPGGDDVVMSMVRQPSGSIVALANNLSDGSVRWGRFDSNGQPDPAFGNGLVLDNMNARANTTGSLRQRGDGALLLAYLRGSDAVVAGFDADGKQLPGFAPLVLGSASLGSNPDRVTLAAAPSGDIYVAASTGDTAKIARLTETGTIDAAFGTAGFVTVTAIAMSDVEIDPAGRFVIAGRANFDRSVVRLTATGELDTSFSQDGRVTIAGPGTESFNSPVFLPDGRLALATYAADTKLTVLADNGDLDPAFAAVPNMDYNYTIRLAAFDGDLMLAGGTHQVFSYGFVVRRVSAATGTATPSFGTDGRVTIDWGLQEAAVNAILVDDLGRAVLGGWRKGTDFDSTLVRIWL